MVAAIIIVVVGGYFLFSADGGGGGPVGAGDGTQTPEPTLAPQLQLTPQEKAGDVGDKKAEILRLVRSGKGLTDEQKGEIGGVMLTKAHIYNFTEAERTDIFEAISQ